MERSNLFSRIRSSAIVRMIGGGALLAFLVWQVLSVFYPDGTFSIPISYCNLSDGPCSTLFPARMKFDIHPRPILAGERHSILLETTDTSIDRVEVELSSVGLDMGTAHAELARTANGFSGDVQAPVCVHSNLKWRVVVIAHSGDSVRRVAFYWKNRRGASRPPS